jgi:hypothetical protein
MQSRVRNRTERQSGIRPTRVEILRRAATKVRDLRADLMLAAEHGSLSDEEGFAILTRHLSANATMPGACALISITREIHRETAARQQTPVSDCSNPWAEAGVPSCVEVALLGVEQRIADQLAEQLADGPWPI